MSSPQVVSSSSLSSSSGTSPALGDAALVVVPGIIWGASFLFIAEGLTAMGPNGVTFLRLLVGFAVLSCFPAVRAPLARGDWRGVIALAVLWMAFPLSMFPLAEQHVSSATTGMLNGAMPLFAVICASVIARRQPSREVYAGLVVGIGGAVLIAWPSMSGSDSRLGIGLILAALLSYGVAINIARPLQVRNGALPVVWRALGVAVVLTAPLGLPALLDAHWTPRALASMAALGAGGTAVAQVLTARAAGRLGAARASATTFIIPPVALLLGVAVRSEPVAWIAVAGCACCLAGAWLIQQKALFERMARRRHDDMPCQQRPATPTA
jgi:drug/metabolite transporter (DMT)-like permease